MEKDIEWNVFFENDERFADLINGCGLNGTQMVKPEDLRSADSKNLQQYETGKRKDLYPADLKNLRQYEVGGKGKKGGKSVKNSTVYRDVVRKVAFGVNFAMIGIENQETVNYALPLAVMRYDTGEYEKQKREISRKLKMKGSGAKDGEYLYGFAKESRLQPVVTFVLYSGEEWDGGRSLKDIIDFTDIPEELKGLVQNYKVNLIEIRKWKDTSVFKTDIRQVFDFIRCSKDKEQVRKLVLNNPDYEEISEDAYDVMKRYANISKLKAEKTEGETNMVNMAKGLQDWALEEREEGRKEVIQTMMEACKTLGDSKEATLTMVREKLHVSETEADGVTNMAKGLQDWALEEREEGIKEGKGLIIKNMLNWGMSDKDIILLAECDPKLVEEVKKSIALEE